jgi:hypothetical protein
VKAAASQKKSTNSADGRWQRKRHMTASFSDLHHFLFVIAFPHISTKILDDLALISKLCLHRRTNLNMLFLGDEILK